MISPPNLRWCFVVWFVTDAGWILLCAIFKTTSSCILRCCFSEPGRNGVGVGGLANLFVSIVFFGRHMARPVRRCKMQIQGSLTLNEAVTVTGALLKSTHHSTPGRNSRGDPQCRAALSFSLFLLSLSAPPTSSLQYNGIHHTRDQRYCMHAALIYRLIPHPAFLKGRLAIVSKSSSHNIILVLPVFTVSFCFLSQESCFVSV